MIADLRIPESWTVDRLKWSTSGVINGVWGDEPDGVNDIPCVRVADFDRVALRVIRSLPTIRAIGVRERSRRVLTAGDLLIEKSGGGEGQPVGCVVSFESSDAAVCSNFIGRIQPALGMCSRYWTFVHAWLYSTRQNIPAIKQTTGIQNLDIEAYLDFRVPYPSLGEQQAIAKFLDRETARLDALVSAKQRMMNLLAEKRRAIIATAVTRGLNQKVRLRNSGISWLPDVPAHWRIAGFTKYLKTLVDYRGRTPEKTRTGMFLVTARNIRSGTIDYAASQEFVDPAEAEEIMRRGKPHIGDLLFTTEAPLGQVALVDRDDIALAQRIIKLDYDENVLLNGFALRWIQSDHFQFQLSTFATGSTALGIKGERLHMLRNLIPPLSEQRAIVEHISRETAKLDAVRAATERTIVLLKERRSALIAAAVTGQLEVGAAA